MTAQANKSQAPPTLFAFGPLIARNNPNKTDAPINRISIQASTYSTRSDTPKGASGAMYICRYTAKRNKRPTAKTITQAVPRCFAIFKPMDVFICGLTLAMIGRQRRDRYRRMAEATAAVDGPIDQQVMALGHYYSEKYLYFETTRPSAEYPTPYAVRKYS